MRAKSKSFFISSTGTRYEMDIEHEADAYIPSVIFEGKDDRIYDKNADLSWDSLMHMSHDLKAEITYWASDVGD